VNRTWIALIALLAAALTVAAATPVASASTLDSQLRSSRGELLRARADLDVAKERLAAAQAEHQHRGLGTLILRVEVSRDAVRFWRAVISDLQAAKARQTLARLEKSGAWRPLIERAAKKYGVSADGLYRLMMMESGGKVTAVGAGRFYGLFQYSIVTWKDDWNPWRSQSVFDGSSQIEASAYAVKKGMGRSLWGNTFPAAF
jgi:soluble lytic murein transglycosylase-like protein